MKEEGKGVKVVLNECRRREKGYSESSTCCQVSQIVYFAATLKQFFQERKWTALKRQNVKKKCADQSTQKLSTNLKGLLHKEI